MTFDNTEFYPCWCINLLKQMLYVTEATLPPKVLKGEKKHLELDRIG